MAHGRHGIGVIIELRLVLHLRDYPFVRHNLDLGAIEFLEAAQLNIFTVPPDAFRHPFPQIGEKLAFTDRGGLGRIRRL